MNLFPKTKLLVPNQPKIYKVVSVGVVSIALILFIVQVAYYDSRSDCSQGWGPLAFHQYHRLEDCGQCELTVQDSFRLGSYQVETVIGLENNYSMLYEFYNDTGRNCEVLVREALNGSSVGCGEPGKADCIEPFVYAAELNAFEYESETVCESIVTVDADGHTEYEKLCQCDLQNYYYNLLFGLDVTNLTDVQDFYYEHYPSVTSASNWTTVPSSLDLQCNASNFAWWNYQWSGFANFDNFESIENWHNTYLYFAYTTNHLGKAGFWCPEEHSQYLFYHKSGDDSVIETDCLDVATNESTIREIQLLDDYKTNVDNMVHMICHGYAEGDVPIQSYTIPLTGNCECDLCPHRSAVEILTLAIAGTQSIYGVLLIACGIFLARQIGHVDARSEAEKEAEQIEMGKTGEGGTGETEGNTEFEAASI